MKRLFPVLISVLLLFSLVYITPLDVAPPAVNASAQAQFQPLNAAFVSYQKNSVGKSYIPTSVSLPKSRNTASNETFPPLYDLRALNGVTRVQDQGNSGTCWAFSALGAAESSLLLRTGGSPDFSEWQMAYYAYKPFNDQPCFDGQGTVWNIGGNDFVAMALLARHTSPITESQAPYGGANPTTAYRPDMEVTNWVIVDTPDEWKQQIMNTGALSISLQMNSKYYNPITKGYFHPLAANLGTNHAVTVVGWDDAYPATNFTTNPGKDGAWIVKNSYGAAWGDNGYFYLSYADTGTNNQAFAYLMNTIPTGEQLYQYDPLGWISNVGFASNLAYAKNIYTATSDGYLSSIGVYAPADSTNFNVTVRRLDNGKWTALPSFSQLVTNMGYAKIPMGMPMFVKAGQQFQIEVRVISPSDDFPLAVERKINGYSSQATSVKGRSFVSADGVTWSDAADSNYDVCLHAYTLPSADNAIVKGISTSAGSLSPTFNPEISAYSVVLPDQVAQTTLTVNAIPGAIVFINDKSTNTAVFNVNNGQSQQVNVSVSAFGSTASYTITLTRGQSTDATLSALKLSSGTLSPAFSPNIYTYQATVGRNIRSVLISVQATSPTSTVSGTGNKALSIGNNTFKVKVRAQNGTQRVYTLNIKRSTVNAPTINSVKVNRAMLLEGKESITIRTSLNVPPSAPATVRCIVYTLDGKMAAVYTMTKQSGGNKTFVWDGRTTLGNTAGFANGNFVPADLTGTTYQIRIYASNKGGEILSPALYVKVFPQS